MAQSRKMSLIEAIASNATAFLISIFANFAVLPIFGMHPSFSQSIGITIIFTMISIVRTYLMRRLFEVYLARFIAEIRNAVSPFH
jgi:hypothetical protein